jgi:hypothetical protein
MLCVACGAQMHLVEVRCDDTMMVRGYEHHAFEMYGLPRNRTSTDLQFG